MSENQNTVSFESGSNHVGLVRTEACVCVEKRYREQLKKYPVHWPMSRVRAEAFTLELLSARTRGSRVRVPALLQQGPDALQMEYCPGTALAALDPESLCKPALWQAFFSFLYSLRDLQWSTFPDEIQEALGHQRPILDCMLRWKTDGQISPLLSPSQFCLGDVSLNNVLFDGAHFYLLDFECAHWGYAGYDVGQFLAMSEAWWGGLPLLQVVEAGFFHGIPDESYREQCLYWKGKLLHYYNLSRHKAEG